MGKQEKEKKKFRKNLFTQLKMLKMRCKQFVGMNIIRNVKLFPGIIAYFQDAGHILGSAGILLEIEEEGKKKSDLVFQVI